MLAQILNLLVDTVATFLCTALLARLFLQAARVGHQVWRSPPGRFVMVVTDWMVLPTRRVIPSAWGYDTSSLLLAWAWQVLNMGLAFWLTYGIAAGGLAGLPVLAVLALAALETVKVGLYLVMGVILIAAIFSWVNPHAPLAAVFDSLTRPWLRPLQRRLPPTGGFDFSPLVVILVLQVALIVLAGLRGTLLTTLLR